MIWDFLQSDSAWQSNDAITFFFIFLCFSLYHEFLFLRKCLRKYVPAIIASIMSRFEQML